MFQQPVVRWRRIAPVLFFAAAIPWALGAQQVGQVSGTVTHGDTGEPLSAVQISLPGTGLGVVTGANGQFTLAAVPAGTHAITAQRLGFQILRQEDVTVTAGQTTTVNLVLQPTVLALQEIVATGLVDPVEGVRSPISVARVTRENMPVAVAGSAIQNLQGQVAGLSMARQSGQPGSDVTMQLRTPTMVDLTTPGIGNQRDTNPLIVVDGVILGSNTTNIEALDIESIEVIRGAAAASLYGSRAAAGVVSITTNRGSGLEQGQTLFSARTELGVSNALEGRQTRHHFYAMDAAQTTYVDADGNPVGRADRIPESNNPSLQFMDKPYPGGVFDNINNVFRPSAFQQHSFSVAQNTASTNFAASLNRYTEGGPLENNDGYQRNSFRINLDHRFLNTLSMSVSGFHSRDYRDETSLSFADLYRAPPDVDLTIRDEAGQYVRLPDEQVDYQNPLWVEASRENERRRVRTLGSAALRWDPFTWMSFQSNLSYDRQDTNNRFYLPKGTPSITLGVEPGRIEFASNLSDTYNAEAQVSLRRDFGPLNVRTTVRALLERARYEEFDASGENFIVEGVPRLNATDPSTQSTESFESEVRSDGYLWDTALDYEGKYIMTVLLRRDGSSLFGPDNRWHTYYRTAGAWRLSEEDWFDVNGIDEFKLSYARGTAGGRPPFLAQYETWSIATGQPRKFQLGNRELRPEHTTEQEISIETILAERYGVQLTYAWQETTDQLVSANLPGFTGYSNQWRNGGTVAGNTVELTLEGRMLQRPNLLWTSTVVADYSTAEITDWVFACESPAWRQYCTGVGMYEIWGSKHLQSHAELDRHLGGTAAGHKDEFMVNDDGLLVWVGEGNTYLEGMSKNLWGTSTNIGGTTYQWGIPFLEQAAEGGNVRMKIGDATHANVGWINNVSFGAVSLHAQFHAKIGGDLVNSVQQGMTIQSVAPDMDQSGKPDERKKPMSYYQAVYSGGGGSAFYVQDGTYVKLRTLSANYRVPQQHLGRIGLGGLGIQTLQVGLIGRNLLTITNYPGWDPEQGLNFAGGSQTDGNAYPTTRSFTAEVSVTF